MTEEIKEEYPIVTLCLLMKKQEAKEAQEIMEYLKSRYGFNKWSQIIRYLFRKFYREEIKNEEK